MPSETAARRGLSPAIAVPAALLIAVLVALGIYLSRPARQNGSASPTVSAKEYLAHLSLSDVKLQAAENFMNQQVVEVVGNISNNGTKTISRIDVTCYFHDISGRVIYRETVPVVQGTSFKPGQTRSFRLPFDTLPSGWNQSLPDLVIAQIKFEGGAE